MQAVLSYLTDKIFIVHFFQQFMDVRRKCAPWGIGGCIARAGKHHKHEKNKKGDIITYACNPLVEVSFMKASDIIKQR